MTKLIDLNIGTNILEHLTIVDALKELISNAIDEHHMNKVYTQIEIFKRNNDWVIKDYGSGIKEKHFTFNINKAKSSDNETIGMFGFGLKDAIAILKNKEIDMIIKTKNKIFVPEYYTKDEDDTTIHIEVTKNTEEFDCGTEIILVGLKDMYIDKAKEKFLEYIQPNIIFNNDMIAIFTLSPKQYIYINGVEVYQNTGFHFSYDIRLTDELKKHISRDRKQIDIKEIKKTIDTLLTNIRPEKIFLDKIKDIFNSNVLKEFSSIKILRHFIECANNLNKYIFISPEEVKIKNKYTELESFVLRESIKTKFKVNRIRDLYIKENFYTQKGIEGKKQILTLYQLIRDRKLLKIKNKIIDIIDNFEDNDKLSQNVKDALLNIQFDSLKEYEFLDDKFLISENYDIKNLDEIIIDYLEMKTDDINIIQNKIKDIINDFSNVFNYNITDQLKTKLMNITFTDDNIDYTQIKFDNLIISKNLLKVKNAMKLKGIIYEYILMNIKQNNAIYI